MVYIDNSLIIITSVVLILGGVTYISYNGYLHKPEEHKKGYLHGNVEHLISHKTHRIDALLSKIHDNSKNIKTNNGISNISNEASNTQKNKINNSLEPEHRLKKGSHQDKMHGHVTNTTVVNQGGQHTMNKKFRLANGDSQYTSKKRVPEESHQNGARKRKTNNIMKNIDDMPLNKYSINDIVKETVKKVVQRNRKVGKPVMIKKRHPKV